LEWITIIYMEIQIAAAKINKYATPESGDTLEMVERPNGGVSVVLADGQSSGRGAKAVSTLVVRKVIALLAEGVRDGAAARAASDALFTEKNGKVVACLNILSVDLQSQTVVLSRNNPSPIFIASGDQLKSIDQPSSPIGTTRNIKPDITEIPLAPNLTIIMFTDGIFYAGDRSGQKMDICSLFQELVDMENLEAQYLADALLQQALRLDQNRPNDDMSVVVLRVSAGESDQIRKMTLTLPVPPLRNSIGL
jgi:serine phosphatase RsbU (regulator of sigma subunit)